MATIDQTYEMSICTDCYFFAHGVLEESEDFETPHISRAQAFEQFGRFLIETNHSEFVTFSREIIGSCEPDSDDPCNCNEASFSWYACDVCGVQLGGNRHSVVILTLGS
jgi:hypothetical protein